MPVELSWYVENRVGYAKFRGVVTAEELQGASQLSADYIDLSSAPFVHFIHDASEIEQFPRLVRPVIQAATVSYTHPRLGWVIAFAVSNRHIGFTGNLVSQVYNVRYRSFETKPEALTFLQTRDATLPNLLLFDQVLK